MPAVATTVRRDRARAMAPHTSPRSRTIPTVTTSRPSSMASADAIRAVYVMRRLRWGAGASGAARSMHLVVGAVAEQSVQTQAAETADVSLALETIASCNYPTPQARLRNRTQEARRFDPVHLHEYTSVFL